MRKQKEMAHVTEQKPFAKILYKLLRDRGVTQEQLANYLGVSRQAVGAYTNGQNTINIDTLVQIADYFDVSCEFLLGRTNATKYENAGIAERLGLTDTAIEMLEELNSNEEESRITKIDVINMLLDLYAGFPIINKIQTYLIADPIFKNAIFVLYDGTVMDLNTFMASKARDCDILSAIDENRTIELGAIEGIRNTISFIKDTLWGYARDSYHGDVSFEHDMFFMDFVRNRSSVESNIKSKYPTMKSTRKAPMSIKDMISFQRED